MYRDEESYQISQSMTNCLLWRPLTANRSRSDNGNNKIAETSTQQIGKGWGFCV